MNMLVDTRNHLFCCENIFSIRTDRQKTDMRKENSGAVGARIASPYHYRMFSPESPCMQFRAAQVCILERVLN